MARTRSGPTLIRRILFGGRRETANIGTGSATGYPVSEYSILGSKSSIVVFITSEILLSYTKSQRMAGKPRRTLISHYERLFIFVSTEARYIYIYISHFNL